MSLEALYNAVVVKEIEELKKPRMVQSLFPI